MPRRGPGATDHHRTHTRARRRPRPVAPCPPARRPAPKRGPDLIDRAMDGVGRAAGLARSAGRAAGHARDRPGHRRDGLGLVFIVLAVVLAAGVWWGAGGPVGRGVTAAVGAVVGLGSVLSGRAARGRCGADGHPGDAGGPAALVVGSLLLTLGVLGLWHLAAGSPDARPVARGRGRAGLPRVHAAGQRAHGVGGGAGAGAAVRLRRAGAHRHAGARVPGPGARLLGQVPEEPGADGDPAADPAEEPRRLAAPAAPVAAAASTATSRRTHAAPRRAPRAWRGSAGHPARRARAEGAVGERGCVPATATTRCRRRTCSPPARRRRRAAGPTTR